MIQPKQRSGSLRDILIEESRRLITEHGIEGFKVADACRAAGVTTAAPYRHFSSRDELLLEVSELGFRELTGMMRYARNEHPDGSVEGLIAIGKAYLSFVSSNQEMYHLMWGATRQSVTKEFGDCAEARSCFQCLHDAVAALVLRLGLERVDLREVTLPLWAGIHGIAGLRLGPRLNIEDTYDLSRTVEVSTQAFVAGLRQLHGGKEAPTEK